MIDLLPMTPLPPPLSKEKRDCMQIILDVFDGIA